MNLIKIIASNQQEMKEKQDENAKEIKKQLAGNLSVFKEEIKKIASVQEEIKEQLAGNSSALEKNANEVKRIALIQQQNANEIKDLKELLVSNSSALQEVVNLVESIASVQQEIKQQQEEIKKNASKSCECEASEPSKQTFVSALVSEFVVSK